MFYGKIWCVVKPSVGLPLFLGAVAVTSLIVHWAILTNTTWFPAFFEGKGKRAELSVDPGSGSGPPLPPMVSIG
jgi:light-harvesting protein B-800-850 alpha chain